MATLGSNATEDELFSQQTQAFLSWTAQQGIVLSPKINLVDLRHLLLGRAVYASNDIQEDEDLFTIPRSAILTPQTSTLPDEVSSKLDDPWLALILALVYEHQRGPDSQWKPYLDVLPTEFDTLMYWSDSELSLLQGSAVLGKIGKETANETFTSKIIPIVRRHNDAFNAGALPDTDLLALCHRMGSTIMAYAFDLERAGNPSENNAEEDGWEVASDEGGSLPVGMVPMADMLNADAERNNAKLFYEEDKVVMRSIKSIASGEEIFNDYGPNPSADLLRRYGYVTSMYAKYDVVEIGQPLIVSAVKDSLSLSEANSQQRLEYLESEMAVDAFDISHTDAEDGQFSLELIAVLRCLAMSQADYDKLKSKGKMPSDKPLNREEQTVLQLLHNVILRRGNDYTTAGFPQATPSTEALHDRSRRRQFMALQVIAGEKAVLEEALRTVDSMLGLAQKRKTDDVEGPQQEKRRRV